MIIYLIGHILEFTVVFLFFSTVFKSNRKSSATIYLVGMLMYAVILLLFFTFDSTIVNILSGTLFNFIFGMLFYKCKARDAIFSALFLTAALTASEFITMTLLSLTNNGNIDSFKTSVHNLFLMALCSRSVYSIISLSIGSLLQKDNTRRRPLFLFLFPVTSTVILYTLWLVSSEIAVSRAVNCLIIASSFFVVISILLTYVFYGKTANELNELYKIQSENDKAKTDITYYAILDKQNEQLKTILHDEKNHLAVINSLAGNPEVSRYINEIYGQISENSVFGNTKNKILDLVINKYQYICDDLNIDFYVSIKTTNLSQIEKTDMTTLFGNLLDNAVDAAKASKSKKIDLSLNKVNGFDVLTCVNSCDTKPLFDGDDLKTTKKVTALHGLGVRSIKRIAKKYNGKFEWSYDEIKKEFTVCIVF